MHVLCSGLTARTNTELPDVRDEAKCARCGGRCCRIYNAHGEEGFRDTTMWFEEWVENFHRQKGTYGVAPVFDPLEIYMSGNEHMIKSLRERGVDPDYCEYRDPKTGCTIPWEQRPKHCRAFKCQEWAER